MDTINNVTIIGAGNLGLALLGYLSVNTKCNITLYTTSSRLKDKKLIVEDVEDSYEKEAGLYTVSDSINKAVKDADMILCTYPAFLRKNFVESVKEFLPIKCKIGFVPGYGGVEFFCKDLIKRGITIFSFQRVPYVARYQTIDGTIKARILSKKDQLYVAAIPSAETLTIAEQIEKLFDIPTVPLREYLAVTLAPSNPLLHITGLYNVFHGHNANDVFENSLKFYKEWNDHTSRILFEYDYELQEICKQLKPLDLSEVISLPVYYESSSPEAMTRKLKSIASFKEVMVPLKETKDGFVPDLDSRMFVEDYPFGICLIKAFAMIVGVNTPVMDMLLQFYADFSGYKYFDEQGSFGKDINDTAIPQLFGIESKEDIIRFYHQ